MLEPNDAIADILNRLVMIETAMIIFLKRIEILEAREDLTNRVVELEKRPIYSEPKPIAKIDEIASRLEDLETHAIMTDECDSDQLNSYPPSTRSLQSIRDNKRLKQLSVTI